jgi:hypothetical protein
MIEVEKLVQNKYTIYCIKGTKIFHRYDGPAVIYNSGEIEWWLNDSLFETKEEWFEALNEEEKIKALFSNHFIEK